MMRRVLGVLAALLLAAPVASGQLLARVERFWSPFLSARLVKGTPGSDLIAEAQSLLSSDPSRVAQVLATANLPTGSATRIAQGLRADALYFLGGRQVMDAQKLYRAVITSDPTAEEEAWSEFMLGNILKIQGFVREAEVAYRASLRKAAPSWRPAALFNLGALELESGRVPEAHAALEAWLKDYGAPGRAAVLYLLAECHAALGQDAPALARLAEARRLDPNAWLARPETGHALAEAYRRSGNLREAVALLEAIPRVRPGTPEGARARLTVGELWEAAGNPGLAVRSYARLLEEGADLRESQTARLRIALLGAEHGNRLPLTGHYEAYRIYFRPAATLEEAAQGKDAVLAQKALRGMGLLARADGKPLEALRLFSRAFQEYPQSPESGRAYEAFAGALESDLAGRLRAGAHGEVIAVYESMKGPLGWVSARDRGSVESTVAEAYEALGAPRLAREIYEELLRKGTRGLSRAELEERILRARAGEGDLEALLAWTSRHPTDRRAQLTVARKLEGQGRLAEARERYLKAASLAPEASAKLADLTEADRVLEGQGRAGDALTGLDRRKTLRQSLPNGAEREAWERSGALAEARLRFAGGDYPGAAQAFSRIPKLSPEDTYLLALAERRAGRVGRAKELFTQLSKGPDGAIASLAEFHLRVAGAEEASRQKF